MAIKDIKGNRYNKLVAIEFTHSYKKNAYWVFKCDCGNLTNQVACSVKRGDAKSCGCHRRETSKKNATTHGKSKTRLYRIWSQMKRRCYLPTVKAYPRYGGRGIAICDEWYNDFATFEAWAMLNGYDEKLTIDRKDNDGNYTPENCRWSTYEEQANNRSSNKLICYNGEVLTLERLANRHGISSASLGYKINKGMCPEEAVLYLVNKRNK